MADTVNPLVPIWYDIVWSVGVAGALVLAVAALVSIGRSSRGLTGFGAAVWTLAVVFLPFLGSIAWFLAGRRPARELMAGRV